MNLSNIKPAEGSVRANKRLGRGVASGKGGTSTRGHKGAKSRSGYSRKIGFEGGQMPLQRRLPKFGFKPIKKISYRGINLFSLQALAEENNLSDINVKTLVEAGLANKKHKIKILAKGELNVKLNVEAHAFSKSAQEAIEKAGGSVKIVE